MFGYLSIAGQVLGTNKVRENQPFVKDNGSQNAKYNSYQKNNFFANFGKTFGANITNSQNGGPKPNPIVDVWRQSANGNFLKNGFAQTLAEKALFE